VCQVISIAVTIKVITARGARLLPALCIMPTPLQQAAPAAVAAGVVQAGDAHAGLALRPLCRLALAAPCAGLARPVLILCTLCSSLVIITALL
jgi:hypothetical protein